MINLSVVNVLLAVVCGATALVNENVNYTVKVESDSDLYHQGKTREGSFNYGYDVPREDNSQFSHKVKQEDDVTYGCYGFIDPDGRPHLTHYVSDARGFRPVKPDRTTRVFQTRVSNSISNLKEVVANDFEFYQLLLPGECAQRQRELDTGTTARPPSTTTPRRPPPPPPPPTPGRTTPTTTRRPTPPPPPPLQRNPTPTTTTRRPPPPPSPTPTPQSITTSKTTRRPLTTPGRKIEPPTTTPTTTTTPRTTTRTTTTRTTPRTRPPTTPTTTKTTERPTPPTPRTAPPETPRPPPPPRRIITTPRPTAPPRTTTTTPRPPPPPAPTPPTPKIVVPPPPPPPTPTEPCDDDHDGLWAMLMHLVKRLSERAKCGGNCGGGGGGGAGPAPADTNAKHVFLPLVVVDSLPGGKGDAAANIPPGSQFVLPAASHGSQRCATCSG